MAFNEIKGVALRPGWRRSRQESGSLDFPGSRKGTWTRRWVGRA